ncbi:hypothetical protein [Neorhodopirellula pilleata]|nr:hypothetical protein [Neorhodopirellula pilleata]
MIESFFRHRQAGDVVTADVDQQKIDEYNAMLEKEAKEREEWK